MATTGNEVFPPGKVHPDWRAEHRKLHRLIGIKDPWPTVVVRPNHSRITLLGIPRGADSLEASLARLTVEHDGCTSFASRSLLQADMGKPGEPHFYSLFRNEAYGNTCVWLEIEGVTAINGCPVAWGVVGEANDQPTGGNSQGLHFGYRYLLRADKLVIDRR